MFHNCMHDVYLSVNDFSIVKRVISDLQSDHKTFSSLL